MTGSRGDDARRLAGILAVAAGYLREVQLPLHILLANRFGELNENQEEILEAARLAADAAAAALREARLVAERPCAEE